MFQGLLFFSGSTWVQFILYLLYRPEEITSDGAITDYIDNYVLFLEVTRPGKPENLSLLEARSTEEPRIMKTHLHYSMLVEPLKQARTKSLLVSRNPKDMLASYYHFYQMNKFFDQYTGTWDEFFELFKNQKLACGDWFDFTTKWWKSRGEIDLMHVIYEDLQRDPKKTILQMAQFLGREITEVQVDKIVEITRFDRMKDNKMANLTHVPAFDFKVHQFMRKGAVGDWKNFFTEDQSEFVDKLYKQHIQGTGMEFYFGSDE